VIFLSRLYEQDPTVETVREALKDYADKSEEAITGEGIIDCTCQYYNIQRADLCGKSRSREIVEPRQVCIYVMTDLTAMPLSSIGEILGGRDHTTIMHARDKVASMLQNNIKVRVAVNDIKDMALKGRTDGSGIG
jgi:chromosomal replication initiator protein